MLQGGLLACGVAFDTTSNLSLGTTQSVTLRMNSSRSCADAYDPQFGFSWFVCRVPSLKGTRARPISARAWGSAEPRRARVSLAVFSSSNRIFQVRMPNPGTRNWRALTMRFAHGTVDAGYVIIEKVS